MTIIKVNRKIRGFVSQRSNGQYFYAFGKPSQSSYIAFDCESIEQGIQRINSIPLLP